MYLPSITVLLHTLLDILKTVVTFYIVIHNLTKNLFRNITIYQNEAVTFPNRNVFQRHAPRVVENKGVLMTYDTTAATDSVVIKPNLSASRRIQHIVE